MKKLRNQNRPRGGASYPCPECGGVTRVANTRRRSGMVVRERECRECGTKFETQEKEKKR